MSLPLRLLSRSSPTEFRDTYERSRIALTAFNSHRDGFRAALKALKEHHNEKIKEWETESGTSRQESSVTTSKPANDDQLKGSSALLVDGHGECCVD